MVLARAAVITSEENCMLRGGDEVTLLAYGEKMAWSERLAG
jgi:hypothetical protein